MNFTQYKITIYQHGGKEMTHVVRNDEANVRDSEVAKKGITRVGIVKVMKACCSTKYLSMNLHSHNKFT